MAAHEVDYRVVGDDLQFVEIELDPNETIMSEAGAMMYMSDGIVMDTKLGVGESSGMFDKLLSAGKRFVTGESLFLTTFTHQGGKGKARVAFGAPYPGKIIPLDLGLLGPVLCQKDSYLCSAMGIDVNMAFTKKFKSGLFGGEGFVLQKLSGEGLAFVHAGGTIHQVELAAGESLRVDTGCIVAFQESVNYDIQFVGNVKSALFGGEGLFFAKLDGPGTVYLQSLPFSRLADRIYKAMPRTLGQSKGEGGLLGNIGGLVRGDSD